MSSGSDKCQTGSLVSCGDGGGAVGSFQEPTEYIRGYEKPNPRPYARTKGYEIPRGHTSKGGALVIRNAHERTCFTFYGEGCERDVMGSEGQVSFDFFKCVSF